MGNEGLLLSSLKFLLMNCKISFIGHQFDCFIHLELVTAVKILNIVVVASAATLIVKYHSALMFALVPDLYLFLILRLVC